MSQRTVVNLWRAGILLVTIAFWQWGWTQHANLPWLVPDFLDPYFVSKPSIVWQRFLEMGCFAEPHGGNWLFHREGAFTACLDSPKGNLWLHTIATLRNTFWGALVGISSGMVVGIVLGRYDMLAKIFEPYIVAINSLPRVALVPLIIIVFGLGDLSKVVTALALVFFIVFFNTFEGTRSVDRDYVNAARFLGASSWQITRTVYIPSALAWVFASLTPAVSFALVGVIVGEFIGAQRGLGKIIIESEATLQIADMMVALLVLMVVGVVLSSAVRVVQNRLLRWQRNSADAAMA
jgi:NitT/TauT family transport system permease protein